LQVDSLSLALGKYAPVPDTLKAPGDTASVPAAAALPTTDVAPATASGSVPSMPVVSNSNIMPTPAAATVSGPLIVEPTGPTGPDSLAIMKSQNKMLRAKIDSLNADWGKKVEVFTAGEVIKATAVNDLKKLKELLDAQIITIAEFTSLKKKYLEKL
jgi:hypothetical protein